MGLRRFNERDSVIEIVKSGILEVGKDNIDISYLLEEYKSREYRKESIEKIDINASKNENECNVYIIPCGSGDVPFEEEFKNKKICVLNFASSKNPGGGFMTGANAQEENLCYHSNLYSILEKHSSFYEYNREHLNKGLYTDGIIFSENVVFFKKNYTNIKPKVVDIITCAAPNRGAALRNGVKEADIQKTMSRRLEQIMKVAIDNGCRDLVLGAFGCGVFKNDLEYVGTEIKKLLTIKGYNKYFDNIIIPTLKINGNEYNTFVKVFRGYKNLIIKR